MSVLRTGACISANTNAGPSAGKPESPAAGAEDPEGASSTDVAATAATAFAALSKTTDDFFSSMISSFAVPGDQTKESERAKERSRSREPGVSPSAPAPPPAPAVADGWQDFDEFIDTEVPLDNVDAGPTDRAEGVRDEDELQLEVPQRGPEPPPKPPEEIFVGQEPSPVKQSSPEGTDRPAETEEEEATVILEDNDQTLVDDKQPAEEPEPSPVEQIPEPEPEQNQHVEAEELQPSPAEEPPLEETSPSPVEEPHAAIPLEEVPVSYEEPSFAAPLEAKLPSRVEALPAGTPIEDKPPSPVEEAAAVIPSPIEVREPDAITPAITTPVEIAPVETVEVVEPVQDATTPLAASPAASVPPVEEATTPLAPSPVASVPSPPSTPAAAPAPASRDPETPTPSDRPPLAPTEDLSHALNTRERQLMSAMEENRNLNVLVEQLRSQIAGLERKAADGGNRELRRLLEEREEEVAAKEQIIQELMAEGEKLSKAELKATQTIKDLRKERKEHEKSTQEMQKKFEASVAEIADLKGQIAATSDTERSLRDALRTLGELNDSQTANILKLEGEVSTLKDDKGNLQMALERAWAELSETRRLAAAQNSAAQSEALEKELEKNQELHTKLEQAKREMAKIEMDARKEISDLRATLARSEEESGWKEDNLRKEIQVGWAFLFFSFRPSD